MILAAALGEAIGKIFALIMGIAILVIVGGIILVIGIAGLTTGLIIRHHNKKKQSGKKVKNGKKKKIH